MIPQNVVEFARQADPHVNPKDITLLNGGFSSLAHKVNTANPFVLLVARDGAVKDSNYAHAFVVLRLLEAHNYRYAPRAIWLEQNHQAIAISYVDGIAADSADFKDIETEKLAIEVMDALLDTNGISVEEYKELAKTIGIDSVPTQTPAEGAQTYGVDWFKTVKQFCPDQRIIDWLEPRVERSVSVANTLDTGKLMFRHGDPSNPNILVRPDGSFNIIDWDSARFATTGPEFLIAYTTTLTDFMKPHKNALIAHVAQRLQIPVEVLTGRVHEYRRYTEVFDVNWAALMMSKISSKETEGNIDDFRKIALERMEAYEADFEK